MGGMPKLTKDNKRLVDLRRRWANDNARGKNTEAASDPYKNAGEYYPHIIINNTLTTPPALLLYSMIRLPPVRLTSQGDSLGLLQRRPKTKTNAASPLMLALVGSMKVLPDVAHGIATDKSPT